MPKGNPNPKTEHLKATQWKPGQSGNPKGRGTGNRDRLASLFLEKMHEDFLEHGEQAIAMAREESPLGYLNAIARILPKELTVNHNGDGIYERLMQMDEGEFTALIRGFELLANVTSVSESGERPSRPDELKRIH